MANFSWENQKKPIVCLAPMAGYTDSAYRQIVKSIEPNVICFSELTSINALEHSSKRTEKMLSYNEIEKPLILQLFGNDPEFFIKAGKKLEAAGASGIDINMGCPAKKVVCEDYGSALLKNPKLAGEIVKALSKAIKIPVSVKMRIAYSKYDEDEFINFIKTLEKSGVKALTIHGRTTKQGYSGEATFEPIYLAKSILKIPVIGNGDITSGEKALMRLKSPDGKITLDGLMIGRATIGNPWILKEICEAVSSKPDHFLASSLPFSKRLPIIKKHLKFALKLHGEKVGMLEMRKHLAGYISGIEGAKQTRMAIMQENDPKKVIKILEEIE